jgi:phenylalanine-4-hydroxylase
MRTQYRIDDFQQNYFVIPSFDELLRVTVDTDFAPLYREIGGKPDIQIGHIMPGDQVITTGTQEYAKGRRDLQQAVLA